MNGIHKPTHSDVSEVMILFWLGKHKFAMSANDVKEVREYDAAWVRAQSPEKTRCRVISLAEQLGLTGCKPERILLLCGTDAALVVGAVDKMVAAGRVLPLPLVFRGREREWYSGLLILNGEVVPLIHGRGFALQAKAAERTA